MTPITEIFDNFLSSITDYKLLSMNNADFEDTLMRYYKTAKAKFYKCKKDLSLVEDELGNKTTKEELDDFEIEVIVSLMLVAHITPQLLSSENLKQSLSDKDFKIYSQANQLREIRALLNNLKRDSKKMITEYTFFNLGEEKM